MKLLSLTEKIKLTKQQELEFIDVLEDDIKKYFRIPIFFIMLFQIYNMVYVSVYTDFTYYTKSSKIYMLLYTLMFIICVLGLILLHKKNVKKGLLLKVQNYYIVFLIMWSLAVTIYDNRVSNNISVHIITMLSIAILVYLPPKLFVPLYLFSDIILITGIELVKHGEPLGSHYSIYVNSTWLTIMALFVGYYHYQSMRQTFLNQSIILEKKRMIEEKSAELDFIAHHDSLTGLQNRRYLANCLNNIYLESRDSQLKTGVFIIDIDDFKSYNDTFGHIKGDECLKRVSNALNLCLSEGFLIRYGGEEFVYLLKNTDLEEMQRIGTELCHTVERLHLLMPNTSSREYLTVSIGGAIGVLNGEESWQAVLEQADQALYKAKNTNKNKCICAVE